MSGVPRVDKVDIEVIEIPNIARRQSGAARDRDPGDLGVGDFKIVAAHMSFSRNHRSLFGRLPIEGQDFFLSASSRQDG
jgi:hypothetical protein